MCLIHFKTKNKSEKVNPDELKVSASIFVEKSKLYQEKLLFDYEFLHIPDSQLIEQLEIY